MRGDKNNKISKDKKLESWILSWHWRKPRPIQFITQNSQKALVALLEVWNNGRGELKQRESVPLCGSQKDGSNAQTLPPGRWLEDFSLGDLNSQREMDIGSFPGKGLLIVPQVKLLPISPSHVYKLKSTLCLPHLWIQQTKTLKKDSNVHLTWKKDSKMKDTVWNKQKVHLTTRIQSAEFKVLATL